MTTLPLSAPVNLRDLGAIPVQGGRVRPGFALRADDLATVPDDVADALVAAGLRAVIDLRSPAECALTGRGPLGSRPTVTYHHVPLIADIARHGPDVLDQRTFGAMYVRMFTDAAAQIVTSLAIMAYTPGTVAFHCAAGQDRTGVLAAALLLTLGADGRDIVADYARTGTNHAAIVERIAPLVRPLLHSLGRGLDPAAQAATRWEFSDVPMRTLVEELTARHHDPLAPLRTAGLTDTLVAQLRARAVDSS